MTAIAQLKDCGPTVIHNAIRHGAGDVDYAQRSLIGADHWVDRFGCVNAQGEVVVRRWTADRVIAALQRFERRNGRRPNATDLHRRAGVGQTLGPPRRSLPTVATCRRFFGSVSAALNAAGFVSTPGVASRSRLKSCQYCGKEITAWRKSKRFCGPQCSNAVLIERRHRVERRARRCHWCHDVVPTTRKLGAKFCGAKCQEAARTYRRYRAWKAGRQCTCCGKELPLVKRSDASFCSKQCGRQWRRGTTGR
jgi:Homing endonuclease associated repeat